MPPVRRQTNRYASDLRRNRTDAEDKLWQAIRNRQLGGFKFRFQASIGPFVADFLCIEAMLIVELDGGQHSEEADAGRTAFLEREGYAVLRFWNHDVLQDLDGVLEAILAAAQARVEKK